MERIWEHVLGAAIFTLVHIALTSVGIVTGSMVVLPFPELFESAEGGCASIERGIIEVPLQRSDLPNQLRTIVSVFVVAGPAAFRGKIWSSAFGGNGTLQDSWLPIR